MTTSSFTLEDVEKCVEDAISEFRKRDLQLLELSVNEQAATHRIAGYLQNCFSEWDVDCEYNRKKTDPKKLHGVLVKPDILIHRRNSTENLLCIEAKKAGGSLAEDRSKLCGFTDPNGEYRYQFGFLMIFSLDMPYSINGEWYQDGRLISSFVSRSNQGENND